LSPLRFSYRQQHKKRSDDVNQRLVATLLPSRNKSYLLNLIGTTIAIEVPPTPAGGAGTGLARRTMATASASNAELPEDRAKLAERTPPDLSMVKATDTEPGEAPGGNRL
jgi:hypothetical protein